MSNPIPFALPDIIDGKYRLIELLGSGGMGTAYKAEHIYLRTPRCIKVLKASLVSDPAYQSRFLREAQLATRLSHPNIAAVHDFGTVGDSHYLASEYVSGSTVRRWAAIRGGRLTVPFAIEIALQVLDGLSHCHQAGLVHRDISPDNIMISGTGPLVVAKIIDLGIAKAMDTQCDVTAAGIFMGNPKYSSPEHFGLIPEGESIDGRADLYSFGIVLYELLTGVAPFNSRSAESYAAKHLTERPPSFSSVQAMDVPAGVQEAVFHALQKSREDRYRTGGEFADALRPFRDRSQLDSLPDTLVLEQMPGNFVATPAGTAGPTQPTQSTQPFTDSALARNEASTPVNKPDSRVPEDAARLERDSHRRALAAGSPAALQSFLDAYPHSRHAADIQRQLAELLAFERAPESGAEGWRDFLDRYPESAHVPRARRELDAAEDRAAFGEAAATGSVTAIRRYLEQFPAGREISRARLLLRELCERQYREIMSSRDVAAARSFVEAFEGTFQADRICRMILEPPTPRPEPRPLRAAQPGPRPRAAPSSGGIALRQALKVAQDVLRSAGTAGLTSAGETILARLQRLTDRDGGISCVDVYAEETLDASIREALGDWLSADEALAFPEPGRWLEFPAAGGALMMRWTGASAFPAVRTGEPRAAIAVYVPADDSDETRLSETISRLERLHPLVFACGTAPRAESHPDPGLRVIETLAECRLASLFEPTGLRWADISMAYASLGAVLSAAAALSEIAGRERESLQVRRSLSASPPAADSQPPAMDSRARLNKKLAETERHLSEQARDLASPSSELSRTLEEQIQSLHELEEEKRTRHVVTRIPESIEQKVLQTIANTVDALLDRQTLDVESWIATVESAMGADAAPIRTDLDDARRASAGIRSIVRQSVRFERHYSGQEPRPGWFEYLMIARRYQTVVFMLLSAFGLSFLRSYKEFMIPVSVMMLAIGALAVVNTARKERAESHHKELVAAREGLRAECRRIVMEVQRQFGGLMSNFSRQYLTPLAVAAEASSRLPRQDRNHDRDSKTERDTRQYDAGDRKLTDAMKTFDSVRADAQLRMLELETELRRVST